MSRRHADTAADLRRQVQILQAQLRAAAHEADRLRLALDATGRAVVLSDPDGRVVYRNRAAATLAEARHGDALAARAVDDALTAIRLTGEAGERVLELRGPPPRTLLVSTSGLTLAGDAIGSVAVIEDVTQRKQLEAVRRDFVANVSHELRTPIGAIGLLAETMVGETDPSVLQRLSHRINLESDRVARIINELLDLSRMEAGEQEAHERIPIGPVVAAAVERVRPVAESTGVALVVEVDHDGPVVMGDSGQLVSAISNLIDNAVKYSDRGGRVDIQASVGEWVDVVVRDTGIGIPSRELDRIFERFYRVDRARSRATGGTGLGLSIVRHAAQNHGGDVLVTSVEGEGSVFTLRLPKAAQ